MRIAVFADVHANLSALSAVLAEIDRLAPDGAVCLGDLVGYNARPREVIAELRRAGPLLVAGNHDREVAGDAAAAGRNPLARAAIAWTRAELAGDEAAFLAALPNRAVHPAGLIAVHGCFLNETHHNGYVTTTMLEHNLEVIAARDEWPTIGLCGHTHVPMCGWLDRGGCVERDLREPVEWPATARAVLVNPGAVGQPRDRDPRASFALLDLTRRRVEVHRVAYDIGAETAAIAAAGLPAQLARRLEEGR